MCDCLLLGLVALAGACEEEDSPLPEDETPSAP